MSLSADALGTALSAASVQSSQQGLAGEARRLLPHGRSVMTTIAEVSPHELTDAQRAFAETHQATPGFRSQRSDAVFMYQFGDRRTARWLVDAAGLVVDSASFTARLPRRPRG